MMSDDDSVFAAVRAGARGYLLKGAAPEEIERAIRAVANGEVLLAPAIASRAMAYMSGLRTAGPTPFPELTDREREVLDLVAARAKLQVDDRSQAIVRAREAGVGGVGESG